MAIVTKMTCELYDTIAAYGIHVIIVAETSSTSFELTCLLYEDDGTDYLINMASFDDITDYTDDVQDSLCCRKTSMDNRNND